MRRLASYWREAVAAAKTRSLVAAGAAHIVVVGAVLSVVAAGCGWHAARSLTLGPIGGESSHRAVASARFGYDDSPWRAVLLAHTGAGWISADEAAGEQKRAAYPSLVDYGAILARPDDLNAYLTYLATAGPECTPEAFSTTADRLAYYINAYNACVVRAVLAEYPVASMYGATRPVFERDWYFRVDGRRVNLNDLREAVRREAAGDPRVMFALCGGAVGSAPLASRPYCGRTLSSDLNSQMRDCLAMEGIVHVSHERRELRVWSGIVREREELFAYYEGLYGTRPETLLSVLLELSRPAERQMLSRAVGYAVVEIPFDGRVNDLVVRLGTTDNVTR